MKRKYLWLFLIALQTGRTARAQSVPTTDSIEDSQAAPAVSAGADAQLPPPPPPPGSQSRQASWKRVIPDLASDQKRIWMFPAAALKDKRWLPVLGVLAGTGALFALDAKSEAAFRGTAGFADFNGILSGNNTALFTIVLPSALYGASLIRRDSYGQQTALLAGEAVADAEIVTTVMKSLDRRLRPADVPARSGFSDTWFEHGLTSLGGSGSFPSGHEIAAISVATVIAERYRSHRWVPYVAYAAAGLIGFSRMSLLSHFPSDVFMGAALGYSITHFIVLRPQ